jgi:hypothetical protein
MAEDLQDFQTDFWKNTVVQQVDVEVDEAALGFDLREIIGAVTVTFILQSFVGALVGKLAEATWGAIKRFVDQLDKNSRQLSKSSSNRVVRMVYRAEVRSIPLELTIGYANVRD